MTCTFLGLAVGVGDGEAVGVGEGEGVIVGVGLAVGVGDGVGFAPATDGHIMIEKINNTINRIKYFFLFTGL